VAPTCEDVALSIGRPLAEVAERPGRVRTFTKRSPGVASRTASKRFCIAQLRFSIVHERMFARIEQLVNVRP